jgi:hypothetical protein
MQSKVKNPLQIFISIKRQLGFNVVIPPSCDMKSVLWTELFVKIIFSSYSLQNDENYIQTAKHAAIFSFQAHLVAIKF